MIKISESQMHKYNNITFFSGKKKGTAGEYAFEESLALFAKENLGPILIEYDSASDKLLDLVNNGNLKKIVDELKNSSPKQINIIDLELSDLPKSTDLLIEYSNHFFTDQDIYTLKDILESRAGYKIVASNIGLQQTGKIMGIEDGEMSYIHITVSERFYRERKTALSKNLSDSFDPTRYVDTQILTFLLMTSLSGISPMRGKRDIL